MTFNLQNSFTNKKIIKIIYGNTCLLSEVAQSKELLVFLELKSMQNRFSNSCVYDFIKDLKILL